MGRERDDKQGEQQAAHHPTSDTVLQSLILVNPILAQRLSEQVEQFRVENAQEEQDPGRLLVRFIQARAREVQVDESINGDFKQQMAKRHGGYTEQSFAMEMEAMPASELHVIDTTLTTGEHWYLVAFTHVENGEYVLEGTNVIRPVNGVWRVDEYDVHPDVGFNEVVFYLDGFPQCSNVSRTAVNINHPTNSNGGGSPILAPVPGRIAYLKKPQPSVAPGVKRAA